MDFVICVVLLPDWSNSQDATQGHKKVFSRCKKAESEIFILE